MSPWWQGIADDFMDVPRARHLLRVGVRLVLAALLGGLIGLNRQWSGKAAGLRTHMLVAPGSAALVGVPALGGMPLEGVARIIQGIVAGIGFLGAGTILKGSDEKHVQGLTTAASIWLTAAVGIVAGMGYGLSALLTAALGFLILAGLGRLERAGHFPGG